MNESTQSKKTTAHETTAPQAAKQPAGSPPRPEYPEATLHVRAMHDPVLDKLGHDPRSAYVEQFWVSVLGPSAVLLLRRLAKQLDSCPDGFDIDPLHWAQELGLGTRGGKHSPLWRTIDRLCRFGMAHRHAGQLSVHRHLPPLSLRQIRRLPPHLQAAHQSWENSLRQANTAA